MTIDEFIAAEGISLAELARRVGEVDASTLSRIAGGVQLPRRDLAQRILDATGGAVTPNDCYRLKWPGTDPETGAGAEETEGAC